jgi:hypothetical protein
MSRNPHLVLLALERFVGRAADEAVPRHNLPAELTSFVGRARVIVELRSVVGRNRLLTLVGRCSVTRMWPLQ